MHQAYFVYKLVCRTNGKIYIGVSSNPKRRLKQHRFEARRGCQFPIHKAMRKHGPDMFDMEVIFEAQSETEMFAAEKRLIAECNSRDRTVGYNVCEGGEGASHPTTESTKQLLSEKASQAWAKKTSEEMAAFKEKMVSVGTDISEETRRKRSKAAKAQHADPLQKALHKAATTHNNQDPEKRARIAAAARKRWADPAFRAKMNAKYATA